MNIAVPPEAGETAAAAASSSTDDDMSPRAVNWTLFFEDGTSTHSDPGTWWPDVATLGDVDGIPLYLTTRKAVELYLYPGYNGPTDERIILELPHPCSVFAFTRYAQSLECLYPGPHLLYTAFGYVLPNYVYLLTIDHASHNANRVHTLLPRPLTSLLW